MLFNSFSFLIFFIVVFIVFFSTKGNLRAFILFFSSCIFYAWFIPKYLLILFLAIGVDYYAAIKIEDSTTQRGRRNALLFGIINTCSLLFIFKYHNFFIDNLNWLSGSHFSYWKIILPVGLSFHVFQSLGYVIDVYWKKTRAERDLLKYANFVIMFPQLVAGPIERASNLLPQFEKAMTAEINVSNVTIGSTLFFYGLFKKLVIADNIGPYVDAVYGNSTYHSGATLVVATILFAFQVYADFSGYSDMAIGVARILGFRFNDNFNTPYFSKSIAEFWRRWHISLSSWLRDYLYYPIVISLGKISKAKIFISTLITFTLVGLWHGANWTYIIFGMIHGTYIIVGIATENIRNKIVILTRLFKIPKFHNAIQIITVFSLTAISFVFFRATSLEEAFFIFKKIFFDFSFNTINLLDTTGFATILFSLTILFLLEYFILTKKSIEELCEMKRGRLISSMLIYTLIILTISLGSVDSVNFIYFQF